MLRYWGFRAPFQPVFLENAAHNTAQYGMSRPAGRWRRRQAANHTPRLCVLRYRTNQASNPTQNPNIAAQCSTHQPNQPPPHPTNASKMQHSASNTKHPRSVLRFVEEKRGSGSKHPDIAARTVSGRGVKWAQVMSDQSRQGKSGRGRAPTPVQTGQAG